MKRTATLHGADGSIDAAVSFDLVHTNGVDRAPDVIEWRGNLYRFVEWRDDPADYALATVRKGREGR